MDSRDRLIWTSQPDFEEYREDLMADFPEFSEDELRDILQASNWDRLQFDREELAHLYDDSILVIADIGLWDGRKSAYREIESCNLMDCFETSRDTLDIEWFVDKNGDLRCNDYHHDGTNHYLYRVWKDNISEAQKDNLRLKLYRGEFSRADVTRCTKRLGDEIGKVLRLDLPGEKGKELRKMIDTCVCCGTYVPEGRMICPGCEFGKPKIPVNKKDAILDYLKKYHCGRRNAVHSKEIERTFSLDDRAVRRKISALRQEGHPICSGDMGYYYAETQKEINSTVHRLNDLVTGVANARTGLLYAQLMDPVMTIKVTFSVNGGDA